MDHVSCCDQVVVIHIYKTELLGQRTFPDSNNDLINFVSPFGVVTIIIFLVDFP